RARAAVARDQRRIRLADYAHAELRLGIVDRMSTNDGNARLERDIAAAANDVLEHAAAEQVTRKRDETECEQWARAHRVDVAECVGRGDAPEVVRIVDYGREEIDRGHQRAIGRNPVDGCIIRRARIHEHGGIVVGNQVTQNLRQLETSELTGSTRAVRELRKTQ